MIGKLQLIKGDKLGVSGIFMLRALSISTCRYFDNARNCFLLDVRLQVLSSWDGADRVCGLHSHR